MLQGTPFTALRYSLAGDDTGPSFFAIDELSGDVSVKQGMKEDAQTFYQVL